MERLIEKYDYVNCTDDTKLAFEAELKNLNKDELAEKLILSDFKNIMNVFIKKICVPEYAVKVSRNSTGRCMAIGTCQCICRITEKSIENGRIPQSDGHDCLFDLYLAVIHAGPGTSHYEVMEKIEKTAEMKEFLKNLKGEKLKEMALAVKDQKYIKEDMDMKSYTRLLNSYIPRIPNAFAKSREDSRDLAVWNVFLDLYLFYLLHTGDVPDELHGTLNSCASTFSNLYDRNPYKGYPDLKVIGQHMKKISTFITSPVFPRGSQLKQAKKYVDNFTSMESDQIEALWPDLMTLFKHISLSKKAKEMYAVLESFKSLFEKLGDKVIEKNHKIFECWIETVNTILEKIEDASLLDKMISRMIYDLNKKYKPAKGDEKYWFPLVKAMWLVPTKEMQYNVKTILNDTKFKRMWNWKENIHQAKEMIANVEKVELPTEGEDRDQRDVNSECGNAVKELIKMLKIQKLEHHIMPDIGRVSMTHMEKGTVLSNSMVTQFSGEIDFQKCTEVIPKIAMRLEPLVKNVDYPRADGWCSGNCIELFKCLIEPYKSSEDIPNEVNQVVIRILEFCMEDDREMIHIEDGRQTIWGVLIQISIMFIAKHCNGGTGQVCIPILKGLMKFRHAEEEFLRSACKNNMQIVGNLCPEVCSDFFGSLLDWYIEEPSMDLMQIFHRIIEINPDALKNRMDEFLDACKEDRGTYIMQIQVFYGLSNKHPKMITEKVVELLMDNHYDDGNIRIQVLMTIEKATKVNPKVFEKYIDKLMAEDTKPLEQHFVNGILVNVAKTIERFRNPVFKYLMGVLKVAKDDTQLSSTLTGLQDLCGKYGPEMFGQHKEYLVERRDTEEKTTIKGQFSALVDQIEGRSLETVVQDVKETKEDVEQLDQRVTGTEVAVVGLTTRVDEHDENIEELGEGLDTVTQRVDFAEKDIEETKIKVEEVDMKTMTNAPRWSRDLTKLMNPSAEHDWRLLAQRLGYSNDDIRAWASQHDPCMAVLSEWYATHKTREANYAVLTALQEMNRMDGAAIVENAMKAVADVVEDEEVDYASPPAVFLSYQWGHQDEVKLIRNHLQMAGYECWMDIGQMGGGDKLFEKIDNGIRGAKVIICCVSEKYAQSPNCNREVNLSVSLGKPMIPLLMEKMGWPPKGSMGPIFSEYLFVRFFQRSGEETEDNRFWPVAKFQEMLMQLNCYGILPDETLIDDTYKDWWIPVQEIIVIDKTKKKQNQSQSKQTGIPDQEKKCPEVFISYQWGKQKEIIALYQRLTEFGLSCWMDIYQMGGGDSLYEKIDSGVRGCKVVLTCITQKYSLSANCRREVSLADALKKPIIPLLLEKMDWPPSGPMSMVFTQLLFINFYRAEEVQMTWTGPKFDELMDKIGLHIPVNISNEENEDEKCIEYSQHSIQQIDNNKSDEIDNERKLANQNTVPRSVSSEITRSAGRPQPTDNKPSPVIQPKPVAVSHVHTNAESSPTKQKIEQQHKGSQNKEKTQSQENNKPQEQKSKSCTVL
ncbi:uncharacterized protein LOC127735734 [Mytilus californianus]|uniref:uncharacterized protein LOC127735734 n=1 Tax=Mytilus californianus TaxID=6549 RepID=UPI002246C342|nr:uncharacterized protein LOC127735734 [Mytilus californianus]